MYMGDGLFSTERGKQETGRGTGRDEGPREGPGVREKKLHLCPSALNIKTQPQSEKEPTVEAAPESALLLGSDS